MTRDVFPPPDLEFQGNVQFSHHGLRLDVLRPRQRASAPVPAIVHVHGGAWVMYGKWPQANVFLARAGFITVSIDYRLAPHATFPAQLHDVKTAVRWLRAHAHELGIDDRRIGVWGVSAGGHLAGLLGTTPGQPDLEGADGGWPAWSAEVQAVGNVCGVMDFLDPAFDHGTGALPLFGAPFSACLDVARVASPISHVSARSAPFLHLHGVHDEEVPVSQAREMHRALRAAGVESELVKVDGGHLINDTHREEVEQRLLAFFRAALADPDGASTGS